MSYFFQWLSDALNTNAHTYEVAPVFLIVERALIEYTIGKLGWKHGGDGITAPGGSLANMYGLMLARHNLYPEIKTKGITGSQVKPLVIFTSEDSHYSVLKGANWMGIGTENVVKVKTDGAGRMIPDSLKEAILAALDNGKVPLAGIFFYLVVNNFGKSINIPYARHYNPRFVHLSPHCSVRFLIKRG